MKKILTLILSFILPGIGHILRGKILMGIVAFLAVVTLLDAWAYLEFSTPEPSASWKFGLLAGSYALIWIICQAHMGYLLWIRDPERFHDQKELAFGEGLRYYVVDDIPNAIRQFERVLRIDPSDRDACFHLAVCFSRSGMYRRAKRSFRKCTELDDDRKWAVEIEEELGRARQEARQRKADRKVRK